MIPITHSGLVYLKKNGNYKQNFYVITKHNGKMIKQTTEKTLT